MMLVVVSGTTLRAGFGLKKCWKMESCGPGIQSLEAFKMKLGYFVQLTGPLKNIMSFYKNLNKISKEVSGVQKG